MKPTLFFAILLTVFGSGFAVAAPSQASLINARHARTEVIFSLVGGTSSDIVNIVVISKKAVGKGLFGNKSGQAFVGSVIGNALARHPEFKIRSENALLASISYSTKTALPGNVSKIENFDSSGAKVSMTLFEANMMESLFVLYDHQGPVSVACYFQSVITQDSREERALQQSELDDSIFQDENGQDLDFVSLDGDLRAIAKKILQEF